MNVCEQLSLGAEVPALPAVGTTVSFEVPRVEAGSSRLTLVLRPHPPLTALRPQAPEVISALRPPWDPGKASGLGWHRTSSRVVGEGEGGFEALSMALGAAWLFR